MHASRSRPDHAETSALIARLRVALDDDPVQAQRIVDRLTSSQNAETAAAHRRVLAQRRRLRLVAESERQTGTETPFGPPAPRFAPVQRRHDQLKEPEQAV